MQLKTPADIEILARGGALLGDILDRLAQMVTPGITGIELDEKARQWIQEAGCTPSFLGYAPDGRRKFPAALCVSVNSAVVHGLPNNQPLQDGDIVGID